MVAKAVSESFNMPGALLQDDESLSSDDEEKHLDDDSSSMEGPTPKKRKIVVDSDDEDDCEEDDYGSKEYTKEQYEGDYPNVVAGVFKKTGQTDGQNWSVFKKELDKIVTHGKIDMAQHALPVYMHIICNQYAKAKGIASGAQWETMNSMKPLYKEGLLKKLGKKQAPRFDFSRSEDPDDCESEYVTTKVYIEKMGLQKFKGLDLVLQGLLDKPSLEYSKKTPAFKLFANTDGFDAVLPQACFAWMKKNKGSSASPRAAETAPARVTSTTSMETLKHLQIPDEELPEPEETEWGPRIWWKSHIIDDDKLEALIEEHPNQNWIYRVLSTRDFLVDNARDAVNQVAKNCGGKMWKKRMRQKIEIPRDEDNKSVYLMKDREDMWRIFTDQLKILKII